MEYLVGGQKYTLSYQELKDQYLLHLEMSDVEFVKNLASALHLACIICFLKEIPTHVCLSDKGIVHELVHLLHIPKEQNVSLSKVRELFKNQLESK